MIKYGGHAMTADELRAGFAQDLVFLRHAGLRPVVVHGGGPQVTGQLDRLGVPSQCSPAGLRVTTRGDHRRGPHGAQRQGQQGHRSA